MSKNKIDLTPSRSKYIAMLKVIIEQSPNKEDVEWCKKELKKWEGSK